MADSQFQHNQGSDAQLVERVLASIRKRLLDLTRRNPLLNYRPRRRHIRIVDELPNPTFQRLLAGESFTLNHISDENSPDSSGSSEQRPLLSQSTQLPVQGETIAQRHLDDRLQTPLDAKDLERRCRSLRTASRTAIDETGANFLYLAVGFLEWYESDHSNEKNRAPLLLLPVELNKGKFETETDTYRYSISYIEEDIESNLSLIEKLREFNYELPRFDEDSDPEAYFERVSRALGTTSRWSVSREMVLGLFSFSKILMYQDLDSARWPSGEKPAEHRGVVDVLLGVDDEAIGSAGYKPSEIYSIDQDERCEQIPLVVDADSSQHSALVDAVVEGKSLAVHGPPGTGKSQTITNLIASCLNAGKTVLFVAEKKAALEVVRSRLDSCGLGDFVLELHSHRTNKGQLHRDLERRMNRRFPEPRELDRRQQDLRSKKRQLIRYSELVTEPISPDGDPFHEAVWRAGRLRSELPDDLARVDLGPLPVLPRPERAEIASLAKELAELWGSLPEFSRAAWDGIDLSRASPPDHPRILAVLQTLRDTTNQVIGEIEAAASSGEPVTAHLAAMTWLAELPRVLAAHPPPDLPGDGWRAMCDDRTRDEIRKLAEDLVARSEQPARFAPLETSNVLENREATQALRDACRRLESLGVGQRTLTELEIHLSDCTTVRDSARSVFAAAEEVRAVLGRLPTFIRDYQSCVALARLFARTPRLVRKEPELDWFSADFRNMVEEKASEAERLRERLGHVQQQIPIDRFDAPSDLQRICDSLSVLRALRFRRLRSEYRHAKRALRSRLVDWRLLRRPDALERFQEAADALEARQAFDSDADAARELGAVFSGLRTDWKGLREACRWAEEVETAAEDEFLARNLLRHATHTAQAAGQAASRLSGHLERLVERLQRAFPDEDYSETPVGQIADLSDARVQALENAIPVLRASRVLRTQPACELAVACEAHLAWLEITADIEGRSALAQRLGSCWQGVTTNIDDLTRASDWTQTVLERGIPRTALSWALENGGPSRLDSLAALAEPARRLGEAIDSSLSLLQEFGSVDLHRWLGSDPASTSLAELTAATENCLASRKHLGPWISLCRVRARLEAKQLGRLAGVIIDRPVAPQDAETLALAYLQDAVLREALQQRPELQDFTHARYEGIRARFAELDRSMHSLHWKAIARRLAAREVPWGVGKGPIREWTDLRLIEHELTKKRRHVPIRQLVRRSGRALQALKPCFMMSPMSVAQYLEPGSLKFDLLIVDEASQVKPEDALGALLRAGRCAIVGDPKQLPPTSFFEKLGDTSEDEEEEEVAAQQSESILEVAKRVFRNRMLEWHYRSKHESLIAFSNSQFYDGRLIVFPSPYGQSPEYGVKRHFIAEGWYRNRRNINEARIVAQAVSDHLKYRPHESLGVATFNSEQRDLIISEIERLQKGDPHFDKLLRKHEEEEVGEPLFIKNLENVQGDEREVIFISTTYGPDPDTRKVYQRFGPITGAKGWRRLNVIFTRARKRLELFTSLRSEDVVLGDGRSLGVAALQNYLRFAETGELVDAGQESGRLPDSDFELDVARVLRAHGFTAVPQVGVAGFFIDVGVKDPRGSGRYVLGVECDGARYHSAASVRDRDRLRQEILERKGWIIHRIWSTDWFNHREAEIERLLDAVQTAGRRTVA